MRIKKLALLGLFGASLLAARPAAHLDWRAEPVKTLKTQALQDLQARYPEYRDLALRIWGFAEVGYRETKSSALLQQALRDSGFNVEPGVAGIPTAFVASYGSGKPVIAILAEFDALPGLAQQAVATKSGIPGQAAGHGCGHNLFGAASVAAGIELQKLLKAGKLHGTVKVYGTPAEEGGSGKVYMVRDGLFKDVDAVLHWHPGEANATLTSRYMANSSAKFRFHGIASHAAASPERGRSALDGVEAMDNMVNMMREHVPQETRIHYVITDGGKAPNVVPEFAEVYYYVRHPNREQVQAIFARVVKAAEGAALGTGTSMEYEVVGGTHEILYNETLALALQRNLEQVGGVVYSPQEAAFGKQLQATLGFPAPPVAQASEVQPLTMTSAGGSTDVGDVSYVVPTVGLAAATWIPGTPAHSWQAVSCSGQEVGTKGMMVAAKTMALTAIDMFTDPSLLKKAQAEFKQAVGGYIYKPLLGDRKPALNYRD